MADDIANLLKNFGANAQGYLEMENPIDYKELPETQPTKSVTPVTSQISVTEVKDATPVLAKKAASVSQPSAAMGTLHSMAERTEPVIGDFPMASDTEGAALSATAAVPIVSSSLRSLLSQAALKRQAETHARNEEASPQPLLNGLPPVTPAQVIAIVSPKGGVGKTTMCAALAGALSLKGPVFAIDLDPQNALQYHMGVSSDVAGTDDVGLTGGNWRSLLRDGAAGTRVLPYGSVSEKERRAFEHCLEEDSHWLARQLARMNLDADDVVILDTPPGRTLYLEQALNVADQVLLVVTPDAASFMVLDHIDRLFEGRTNNFGRGKCCYIVNQFDASRTFCQDMLEVLKHRFGTKLVGVVPFDHAISEGLAFGIRPLLEDEESPARLEIITISDVLKPDSQASSLAGGRT